MNYFFQQEVDSVQSNLGADTSVQLGTSARTSQNEDVRVPVQLGSGLPAPQRVPKRPAHAYTDTTCFVCPQSHRIELYQLFESENQTPFSPSYQLLQGRKEYRSLEQLPREVFVETEPASRVLTPQDHIRNLYQPHVAHIQWIILPLVLLLLLLTVVRVLFRKNIQDFFYGLFYIFPITRMINNSTVPLQRLQLLLDILYFLVVPLFVFAFLSKQPISLGFPIPWSIAIVFAFLFAYRILRFLFARVLAGVSGLHHSLNELYYNQLVFPRVLGVLLIPLLFLYVYALAPVSTFVLYLTVGVSFILMLLRQVRTFTVFINKGFSVFYYILYLCTLEVIPILILVKGVSMN